MAVALLFAFSCSSKDQPERASSEARTPIEHRTAGSDDLAALPAARPDWTRTLESSSGSPFLEHVAGPVVAGKTLLVSSSAIGVAAVDAATGALRWQRGDHPAVSPVAVQGREPGPVWLPGPCARAASDAMAAPGMGCIEILDANAMVVEDRTELPAPPGLERGGLPSQRRALGAWGRELLWAQGSDVLAIKPGRDLAWTRYRMPEALRLHVCGWLAEADTLLVATCDGLAGFARAAEAQRIAAPAWHVRATRTTSVAGPVRAGERVLWVHDEALEAVDQGRTVWRAQGRYAHAPGSVRVLDQDRALAVSLDRGIEPAVIDVERGQVVSVGQRAPGIQVLAAVLGNDGAVLVVRLDSSLTRDAIIAYDREHRIAWAWPLPMPATPRADPIGLAASDQAVFVFHDGQHLTRLPWPG
jgi:hypothetical protein